MGVDGWAGVVEMGMECSDGLSSIFGISMFV